MHLIKTRVTSVQNVRKTEPAMVNSVFRSLCNAVTHCDSCNLTRFKSVAVWVATFWESKGSGQTESSCLITRVKSFLVSDCVKWPSLQPSGLPCCGCPCVPSWSALRSESDPLSSEYSASLSWNDLGLNVSTHNVYLYHCLHCVAYVKCVSVSLTAIHSHAAARNGAIVDKGDVICLCFSSTLSSCHDVGRGTLLFHQSIEPSGLSVLPQICISS